MRIASLTSTQINFTGNTAPYSPAAGYGYFLQNHPLACTQSGEWAFCNGNIYLYSATDPTSSDVEISSLSEGYIVVGMLNTVFRNLRFEGFSSCALDIGNGSSGLTVQNCEFAYMNNGINLNGCLNVSLSQNSFANIYNNAVNAANQSSGSAAMTGNTFSHIGDVTGRAGRDDDAGIGVFITAAPYTVTGNQFDSIGLNAVAVYSAAGVDIENNFITNACLNKQNGGGIFFWSTGTTALAQRVVRKNIIGNVSGSGWGMPAGVTVPWVFGIFLSTNSNDVLVDGNTVFNSLGGMALYDANSIVAHANTFYNCAESMYLANDAGNPIRDCTLQKNLCVNLATAAPDQNTFTLGINYTGGGTIPTANAWDANYYWTPFVDAASVYVTPSSPANMFTVAQWRGVAGQDAHSVEEPLAYSAALGFSRSEFVFFDYAAGSGKTDTLTNGYLDADSHWTAAGVLTIAPYSSRVLVRANSTPPTATVNPALAAGVKDYNSVLAYPNPAKATGHFAFDLEKPGQITVDVYNVAGRKIATLQNNFSQAGAAQIDWDSHTLPAGVYYCKAVLHAADGSTRTYPKFKVAIFR
jgi:parallel beta-helix repeat protein